MACWEQLHLASGLPRAPGAWEIKGLLVTCLELSVLLSSESGNQMAINGDKESSPMDEESTASPSIGCLVVFSLPFTHLSPFYPISILGTRKLLTMSNCSYTTWQAAAIAEA